MSYSIDKETWKTILQELKKRGLGLTESGAFLLAPIGKPEITKAVFYDDLDPECLKTGAISFSATGYDSLWEMCKLENFEVIADVHTHPYTWVGQSDVDKEHPMMLKTGHLAIILPEYAQDVNQGFENMGLYEYLGDLQWNTLEATNNSKLKLRCTKV